MAICRDIFFKGFKKEVKSLITVLLFFMFYYFFIDYTIKIISKFIYISDNYYPNLSYQLISLIFIYLVSVFLNFLIMKVFFGFSFFSQKGDQKLPHNLWNGVIEMFF